MLKGMRMTGEDLELEILFPVHPRTRGRVKEFGLSLDGIRVIESVGFLDFLQLESNAGIILTDSGGVQEEACILGVPCVTLRDNAERPEAVEVGANMSPVLSRKRSAPRQRQWSAVRDWRTPSGMGLRRSRS